MDLLLRRSIAVGHGDTIDHELSGRTIRLGSEAESDFQLAGLAGDLQLRFKRGSLRLATSPGRLLRDGRRSASLRLQPGESAQLDGLTLRAFSPPPGFDAALEVTGEVSVTRLPPIGRPAGPWSLRSTSWLLFFAVLLFGLALPYLTTHFSWTANTVVLAGMPSDLLWSSGPLAAAHRTAGLAGACERCHRKAFEMVPDSSCTDCHAGIREHADVERFASAALGQRRCAACHREHNEPAHLVRRDKPLCTSCHAEPSHWRVAGSELPRAVQSFSADTHPQFRLSHWVPQGDGAALGWQLQRERKAPAELQEHSGLRFNHAVHLDPDKVRVARSEESLRCDSCHSEAADGEHFEPVRMNRHCRSCHELNFDPFDPDIVLPHGNTRAAFEAMEAHFIREFTDPQLRAERARSKPRRLPGRRMGEASCDGDGLDCGRREAAREAEYQFADTGCVTCHEVRDTGASEPIDRWFVHPVRLTTDWYSEARFDHRSHLSLGKARGDEACTGCHGADTSTRAQDVLMPERDSCLECHSDERSELAVDCVACHRFHRPQGTLSTSVRGVTSAAGPGAGS